MLTRKRSILTTAPVNIPPPDDSTGETLGNKRKKKNEVVVDGPTRPKRARRRPTLLEALFDLPIELSQEIFSHLEPLDLLHLARTSKQLRKFFLDRSSRTSIWQRSFSNYVPALPECPPDLTEPSFGELAFGDSCSICWKTEEDLRTIWAARIRTCRDCINVYFHRVSSEDRPYGLKLFDLLPGTSKTRYNGVHKSLVYKPFDIALFEEFRKLESPEKEQWVIDKIKEWKPISAHARRCGAWACELESRREAERLKAIEDRKALVVERVKALGWEEELSLLSNEQQRLENLTVIIEACESDLTERVLSRLERHAVQHLTKIRTSRLKAERRVVLRPRLLVLKAFHKTCVKTLPVNAIHPTTSELFRVKSVFNIIDSVPAATLFTQKHLAPIRNDLDNIIRDWREDIELKLLELISPGLSDIKETIDVKKIFNLATSVFSCSYSGCSRFLRYPEVMMHACATKARHEDDAAIDVQIMNDCLHQTFWNFNRCITVNPEHVAMLCDLLTMVDLDPLTTTVQELNTMDPIFECTPCYRSATGRAMMTWAQALVHCFDPQGAHSGNHGGFVDNLVVLHEIVAQGIRTQMAQAAEFKRSNDRSPDYNFVCVLCKEEGNFTDLQEHLNDVHGDIQTDEGDIDYKIDADRTLPLYRLPPPNKLETKQKRD